MKLKFLGYKIGAFLSKIMTVSTVKTKCHPPQRGCLIYSRRLSVEHCYEVFFILSPSLSQILTARLILYKMADSSTTAAVLQRETAQCQCTWWTTYSLGKEVNGHVFFRSHEEAFKAIVEYEEEYEVKTTTKFVCWKRHEDFGNNGKLVDVRMGGKQRKFHKITAAILNSKYIHKDFG